jgi:transposase-like protein
MKTGAKVRANLTLAGVVRAAFGSVAFKSLQARRLNGEAALFKQLKNAQIKRVLGAELTKHLIYERGDPVGRGSGNGRDGTSSKTLLTEDRAVEIAVPRGRAGSFEPHVAKGQTRFDGFNDIILKAFTPAA